MDLSAVRTSSSKRGSAPATRKASWLGALQIAMLPTVPAASSQVLIFLPLLCSKHLLLQHATLGLLHCNAFAVGPTWMRSAFPVMQVGC